MRSIRPGASREIEFVLPERPFQNPVARALMAIRRGLSLHPDDRPSAVTGLEALLMGARRIRRRLRRLSEPGRHLSICWSGTRRLRRSARRSSACGIWRCISRRARPSSTARALDEARQAARDALDKAIREPNDANREALDKRLKELEEAIDQHLQALVEEARRNNEEMPFNPDAQQLSNRDLDKMAEQAREAAREGRMEDAQRAHGGAGAHAGQAAQRTRRAWPRGRAHRSAAAARPPADGRGAGHDRSAGRTARPFAEPRR